jgi:hypothetical protein
MVKRTEYPWRSYLNYMYRQKMYVVRFKVLTAASTIVSGLLHRVAW